ncbi:MAG: NUDIX hydrolase [Patescibacteria group bacterium]|jgi:8-oxo-dGTP pyrophosphatase MutT (NUDIX family)
MPFHIKFRVKVVFTDEAGKILIMWAPDGKIWDLPGGHVDIPEQHLAALKRELKEELDLDEFPEPKPIYVYTNFKEVTGRYAIIACYQIKMNDPIKKLSNEHSEFKWVSKEDLLKISETEMYLKELVNHIE